MLTLTPDECRVLGVMVEKAQTVASQYPITLNALVTGCNQKNNRFPVTNLSEEQVLDALDGLRAKKLASEVMLSGSRVSKYRHLARETLGVSTLELVLLTELLLRGPQALGELRGHASRMHSIETMEAAQEILRGMMSPQGERPVLVKEVPPPPGSRGNRFVQLLCPTLHRLDVASPGSGGDDAPAGEANLDRVQKLEEQVSALNAAIRELAKKLGEQEPRLVD
jgi:uncharacterized protein YceH (UPF0502 family)